MTVPVPSPCIGICSTVYGDTICRGCKRDYREVIDWNKYSETQKQAILQRLQQQLEQVVAEFITVKDASLLHTHVTRAALRPVIYAHPLCWAYELLRLQAPHMSTLSTYGICAHAAYTHLTPNQLFTLMDDRLYALAHMDEA